MQDSSGSLTVTGRGLMYIEGEFNNVHWAFTSVKFHMF